jgi:hypothetical protein
VSDNSHHVAPPPGTAREYVPTNAAANNRTPHGDDAAPGEVTLYDFYAVMPLHGFLNVRTCEMWPAASVNARIAPLPDGVDEDGEPMTIKASTWLDRNRHVEQLTWAPGESQIIENRVIAEGGWIDQPGYSVFNLYRPGPHLDGDPYKAQRWLDHAARLYDSDASHIIYWLAHRLQRPGKKINHALVLGGPPGIGKDTILEPVKLAVGPWNFQDVSPANILGRFNGHVKSVILRVSEARDLGEHDRYAFYEHTKTLTAAPPDVLRCDEKNLREYAVPNVTGVIFTTNRKMDGIYLPADDRRHYVAWSERTKEEFSEDYFRDLYRWYEEGGYGHVAAYLRTLDLSQFDAKAPPKKTTAFWSIVDANRAPEDADLTDVMERLRWPQATTLACIIDACSDLTFVAWLRERKNSRAIPHRLEAVGYVKLRNDGTEDGRWKVGGKNQAVYVRAELPVRERHAAASEFIAAENARQSEQARRQLALEVVR